MTDQTKFTLTEDRIPTHWVNLLPDLPGEPLPPLSPNTLEPAGPADLMPIFPMEIIDQDDSYLAGKLEDPEFSEADMEAALERLPDAPAIA